MQRFLQICLFLVFPFIAVPALALPAPMSNAQLVEKSTFVGVVRVQSVTCTAVTPSKEAGDELQHYLAKLEVVEVKKGDVKPGDTLLVTWRTIPRGLVGGNWSVNYYPGEEVMTHLVKGADDATYKSTWWNAKGQDIKEPPSTKLPTQPGETFVPPKVPTPGGETPL